MSTSVTR